MQEQVIPTKQARPPFEERTYKIRKPRERERWVSPITGESLTDTSHGNDTDINHIVARCTRTGLWPPVPDEAIYADVSNLQKPLDQLMQEAREAIEELNRIPEPSEQEKGEIDHYQDMLNRYDALEERLKAVENVDDS